MKVLKGAKRVIGIVLSAAIVLSAIPATGLVTAATNTPIIIVDTNVERGEVSPYLLSANHRFAYGGFGMYDLENNKVYDDFLEKNKEVNWGAIRYPGGTIANLFKWKDTIGPLEERRNVILGNSYLSDFPKYGLDEHMQFCEDIGANAIYVVAEASEEPQDAADLVEYLNAPNDGSNPGGGTDWAAIRAKNGHEEPYGVVYFEIGNEMHIANQRYWMSNNSAYGTNKSDIQKYAFGDTVAVKNNPLREYGTWSDNLSKGTANQAFYTRYYPVEKDTQTVYVDGEAWTAVESLSDAAADAKVYTFDPATGECIFGDGEHGMIPSENAVLTVDYNHVHASFMDFYDAMKAIDPSIKVLSCMEGIYSAGVTAEQCDGIAFHDYNTFASGINTNEKIYDNYMTLSDDVAANMREDLTKLRTTSKSNDTIAAVTEYGTIGVPDVEESSTAVTMDEARPLARGLNFAATYIGAVESGIETAAHQGYTAFSFGNGPALPNAGQVYNALYASDPNDESKTIESSMALSFKLLGNHTADTKVLSSVAYNPVVNRTRTYEAFRVMATKDSETGDVYLIVVNRDPNKAFTTTVNLPGYKISGEAQITTFNAASAMACNTPEHPNDVELVQHTARIGVGGDSFAYTFPAHSIVGIKLKGATEENLWADAFETMDFEADEIGAIPNTFKISTGAGDISVQSNPTNNEEKSLRIMRTNANMVVQTALDGQSITSAHTGVSDLTRISMRVYAEQQNARMNFVVTSTSGQKAANLSLDSTGYFKNNGKEQLLYQANKWYDIEIVLDQKGKKYYMYVDGKRVPNARTDYNNSLTGLPTYLIFEVENAAGVFYIDNYRVETLNTNVTETLTQSETVHTYTQLGVAPTLPQQVNLLYNTGKTEPHNVTWDAIEPEKYRQIGTFVVNGTIEGSDYTATAIVGVVGIKGVQQVNITTKPDVAPILPSTVTVEFSDGSTKQHPVTWDAVNPESYAKVGFFFVSGTVEGTDIKASMRVTVLYTLADEAVDKIAKIPAAITTSNLQAAKALVTEARTAYNAMTQKQKDEFDAALYAKLTGAERKIAELSVVKASSIKLSKTKRTMTVKDKYTLKATVTPSNTTNKVVWSSSNPKVATVTQSGVVYAKAAGKAVITASIDGVKATCKLTVEKPTVKKVRIKKGSKIVSGKTIKVKKKSKKITLKAVITPKGAAKATWSTTNKKRATVKGGKVTLKAKGKVKIKLKAGKKTATVTIKII